MTGSDAENPALVAEVAWVADVLTRAVKAYIEGQPAPRLSDGKSLLPQFGELTPEERPIAALALAAGIAPEVFDVCSISDPRLGRPFTVFGMDRNHGAVLRPTLRTAGFLFGGAEVSGSMKALELTASDRRLMVDEYITFPRSETGERISARLSPGPGLSSIIADAPLPPITGAHLLRTQLDPDDLVVPDSVRRSLEEIKVWLAQDRDLHQKWGLGRFIDGGLRVLFYGPPGTGKTLAAALLGKEAGMPVYRVDLSNVVSKWIGETEKNLSQLFDQAERQNAVLFFDEADALFGKRTETRSSNDRFANQEVAYLLQRIESAQNLVILATNLRANIDAAFTRRFQVLAYFPTPDADARARLWHQILKNVPLSPDVDIAHLASIEDVTGATIVNAVRSAVLAAEADGQNELGADHIAAAMKRERYKEGGVRTS